MVLRPTAGGIRGHLSTLLRYLDRERFCPYLVCPPDGPGLPQPETWGAPVYHMKIQGNFSLWDDLKVMAALSHLARSLEISIIHAHGYKAGFLSLWAGYKHKSSRLLCSFHNPLPRPPKAFHRFLARSLVSTLGRRADHLIVISLNQQQELIDLLNLPAGKISQIYNGIDPTVFSLPFESQAFRRELRINESIPLVGTVTRLIRKKGAQYLIMAARLLHREFPQVRYVVVGDGPYQSELEAMVKTYSLEGDIIFTGFRPDIPEIMNALDIFVLPTTEEAQSISILEAMAAGKPVIATATGGVPEIVTEETGILVRPENPEELAAALKDLLLQPDKRSLLGQAGRQRVKQYFTDRIMVEKYSLVYTRVASLSEP